MVDPRNLARRDPAQAQQLAAYAERQIELARAERDLRRQQFDFEKEDRARQREGLGAGFTIAMQGALAADPLGGGARMGVLQAGGALFQENDRQTKEFIRRSQEAMDTIAGFMEELASRSTELRNALRDLDAAHTN